MRAPTLRLVTNDNDTNDPDFDEEIEVDNFAGGGGASMGFELALGRSPAIAVNHDPEALAMHRINHPACEHYVEDVFDVDPRVVTRGRRVGAAWFSPDCFPAGTLVLTTDGYLPIEQIAEGDFVLTHKGRYRPVTAVMSTRKTVDSIRGHGHPGLRVSSEHPIYVRTEKFADAQWMRAGGVERGMFWATPTSFPALEIPRVPMGKNRRALEISTDLMWLAGRYVADGWTRISHTRAELVLAVGPHKVSSTRERLVVWGREGSRAANNEMTWGERETATAYQFSTNHRGLVKWLRAEFGHRAEGKSIPAWLLGADRDLREAFLAGYLAGDGCVVEGRGNPVVQCTTVSKALAFGLRSLASSLGKTVGVYFVAANTSVIEGRQVNALPYYQVRWRTELSEGHRQTVTSAKDGAEWLPIRDRVDGVADDVEVFNISVDEDETYIVEGVVVHNCKHHSKAKGGPPVRSKEIRGLAWVVVNWARTVRPRVIFLENVEEFLKWGPLNKHGRIIKRRAGEEFAFWWASMERLGYKGEFRILRACDYGAPTSRKRLFVIFRCDGQPIVWPEPTHGPGRAHPYRTAAECIDFDLPCPSIFMTKDEAKAYGAQHQVAPPKRPLADKTLRRIARGLRKYVLEAKRPFVVPVSHGAKPGQADHRTHDIADPLRTITGANRGELAVVQPYVTSYYGESDGGGNDRATGADQPLPTQTTANRFGIVAPTLVQTGYGERPEKDGRPGQEPRMLDLHKPLGTVVSCAQRHALVSAFLAKHFGDRPTGGWAGGSDIGDKMGTVTTKDHHSLVTSNLVKLRGTSDEHVEASSLPADEPVPTISAGGNHVGEVRAFLAKYYGQSDSADLGDPMGTLTTKERFGLVTVEGELYQIADIGMRMLTPRELFRAQGFPDSYVIDPEVTKEIVRGRKHKRVETVTYKLSTKAQVRMVGNSVCPPIAAALVRANYAPERYAITPIAAVA